MADIDAIISAMVLAQPGPILDRLAYEQNSCGPQQPAPACPDGKPDGTLVDTISVSVCSQYYLRRDQAESFIATRLEPGSPFAVFRDISGMRQLIFDRGADGGIVSRVTLTDKGQIVAMAVSCASGKAGDPGRFDLLKEAQTIYPYAPDRFILPPPK